MKAKCILTYFTFHIVIRCTHKKNRILRNHRQSFVSVDCCRFFSCMLCLRCPFTIHTRFVNEFLSFLFSFILICVNNKRTMSYLQFVVFVLTIFQQSSIHEKFNEQKSRKEAPLFPSITRNTSFFLSLNCCQFRMSWILFYGFYEKFTSR